MDHVVTLTEALALGTRQQQAGRLAEAEQLYRQVLAADPGNAHALHLLGTLALQSRQFETAAQYIQQAIRADRRQAVFYANLGEACRHAKHSQQAIEAYRTALRLQPSLANAQLHLGELLRAEGELDEAVASFRAAIKLRPDDTDARAALGQILQEQGKLSEAETCFRRVLRINPKTPDAHFDLGSVLHRQNRLDEAEACYRATLELDPDHVDAHSNLSTILQARKAYDEAREHFQAVVTAQPQQASSHFNLGTSFQAVDRLEEAAACYRAALALDPNDIGARNALGAVWLRQGRIDEALAMFEQTIDLDASIADTYVHAAAALQKLGRADDAIAQLEAAIRIDPNCASAYSNLAMLRGNEGKRDDAVAAARRALELEPTLAEAHNNLAVALLALGQLDEAIAAARKATQLGPACSPAASNLLYMLNYHPTYDAATIFAEHRAWGAEKADPLTAASAPHTNDRTPGRRLRVGYVSAHFASHAVNFFSEPILASHDHEQFEVFCYAHVPRPDDVTARLRPYADHWRDIAYLTDQQAADLVRADKIDILVDLTGHIGGTRLLVFARKSAPVQATYIGYQNTTGMRAMDYRLTDAWADPPGETDPFYTEKLVRLPRAFFCYRPSPEAPPVTALPSLENGYTTFGSFNAFPKITPQVLTTWARLLEAVPRSRLIILGDAVPSMVDYLTRSFESHGIDSNRLTLADRRPRLEYLALINRADIALDPFPFNGHTTTCDALWQGVPVVTLAGRTYASRFGSSAHVNLGLDDLIARSPEEYVAIAARLASDVGRLATLRGSLRERMASSPLLDFTGFTRRLEAAYRQMWLEWCNRPPE